MDPTIKRRDVVLNTIPKICIERACIYTEAYQENEHLPMILRRAKALRRVLTEMSIYIEDGEQIVGNQAWSPRAAPLFPEYGVHWILEELDQLEQRPHDAFRIDEASKRKLKDTLPYWKGKSYYDRIRALADASLRGEVRQCFDFDHSSLNQVISNVGQVYSGAGHVTADFEKVVKLGLEGIMETVRSRLTDTAPTDGKGLKKILFYRSVLESLEGVVDFAGRFAALAAEKAAGESSKARRKELDAIAGICKRVPSKPAESFWEALQATWFIHLILQIESNGHSMSLGRMDQYLYPFYEKDIRSGVISQEEALALVKHFIIKCLELNKLRSWANTKFVAGYPLFQQITLGGQTPGGEDAVNDLTYLFLDALSETGLSQPSISVRIFNGTSDQFARAAAKAVVRHKGGLPAFFNDEVVIPLLLNIGVTLEEARDWSVMGCAEPQVMGKFLPGVSACHVNLLKILEITLNGGINPSTGNRLYPSKGRLPAYESFEELLAEYKNQLEKYVNFARILDTFAAQAQEELTQTPFLSALIAHRIETGKDVTDTAAPTYANQVILGHGAVNVGNALAAVGKLVFQSKVIDPEELMAVLQSNFEGIEGEMVRQLLVNKAPKYGNDDDTVDLLTRRTLGYFLNKCHRMRHCWGGRYGPTPQGVSANVPMGASVGATPDGRKAGEPLADNTSPSAGTDLKGPTAVLKSVAKLDHEMASNGTILNLKLHPSALKSSEGIDKFSALMRSFFDIKGMQVQFNIVSAKELLEAQEHPEKHQNLVVKVAGYSAQFNSLDRRLQDQIIARTTHELS